MSRRWEAIAVGLVVVHVTLTISPTSHDFRTQGLKVPGNFQVFTIVLPTGAGAGDNLDAQIQGADAMDFWIDRSTVRSMVPGTPQHESTCLDDTWRSGTCTWVVEFRPTSVGVKTATLIVADTRGNRGTAALKGIGITDCRFYLVPCNYGDYYSGGIRIHTSERTTTADPENQGAWTRTVNVDVKNGVVTCTGDHDSVRDTYTAGKQSSHSVTKGVMSGQGLFALEFVRSSGKLVYRMSFACPSYAEVSTLTDFTMRTTMTDTTRSEPADWREAALVADPQAATEIFMAVLTGSQLDPRPNLGDNVTGTTQINWSLKRQW